MVWLVFGVWLAGVVPAYCWLLWLDLRAGFDLESARPWDLVGAVLWPLSVPATVVINAARWWGHAYKRLPNPLGRLERAVQRAAGRSARIAHHKREVGWSSGRRRKGE